MPHQMDTDGTMDWRRALLRYGLAAAMVVVAALLRWWLEESFGNLYAAFITFYPAVLLAAITLGGGPGVLATLLSAAVADYFFMPPYGSFHVAGTGEIISLVVFTFTCLSLSAMAQWIHRTRWVKAFAAAQAQEAEALTRANAQLVQQGEELKRSNHDLEQFAYVASHDIQEPLRMVTSFGGILQDRYQEALDAKGQEYLAFIVEAGQRMQSLVQGLLDYSRVRGQRRREPVGLGECVTEALANLRASIEETGASLDLGAMPTVEVDRRQMIQVFQNLISNAVKFRSEKPLQIKVSARPDGELWIVRVADNGIGIDPKYADQIFQIFQRLHTRDKYPGTGIGLAICRKIVEGHGGTIWMEPAPEQGSAFCFTLAAAARPAPTHTADRNTP